MSKAKKTTGAPFWYSRKFALTEDQRKRLADLLGFDWDDLEEKAKVKDAIRNIEYCLGDYSKMVKSIDQEPTAASYIAELTEFQNNARTLLHNTMFTSYWMRNLMQSYGYNLHKFIHHLAGFNDNANSIQINPIWRQT